MTVVSKSIHSIVSSHLKNNLLHSDQGRSFFAELAVSGELILFGGALRDIIDGRKPRDYDFVLKNSVKSLDSVFSSIPHKKNRFGGYSFTIDENKFDLWQIENTWAFQQHLVKSCEENLTRTVFFNFDSAAINLQSKAIYIDGYVEAKLRNTLDIVLEENPYPALCVLRAFNIKKKNKFFYSARLLQYIQTWISGNPQCVDELLAVQEEHYNSSLLSSWQIREEIEYVEQMWKAVN